MIWYIIEFTNISRRILTYEQNVKKWTQALIQRFKQQVVTATIDFLKEFYIMKNVRKSRKSRKYAQKIIRLIKSAQMKSVFNQFNIIYNEVKVKLKKNLKRSTNMNIIDEYFEELNECKQIWWKLTNDRRIQSEYDSNRQYQFKNYQSSNFRSSLKKKSFPFYKQSTWNNNLTFSRNFQAKPFMSYQ